MPKRRLAAVVLVVCVALVCAVGVSAQEGNLLRDPGFEGEAYKNVGVGDGGASFNVPAEWNGWFTQSPRDLGAWQI